MNTEKLANIVCTAALAVSGIICGVSGAVLPGLLFDLRVAAAVIGIAATAAGVAALVAVVQCD